MCTDVTTTHPKHHTSSAGALNSCHTYTAHEQAYIAVPARVAGQSQPHMSTNADHHHFQHSEQLLCITDTRCRRVVWLAANNQCGTAKAHAHIKHPWLHMHTYNTALHSTPQSSWALHKLLYTSLSNYAVRCWHASWISRPQHPRLALHAASRCQDFFVKRGRFFLVKRGHVLDDL